MNEKELADLIDCKFPYNDEEKALELIHNANSISPNAMFSVLEELCRPPKGEVVVRKTLIDLIDTWNDVMSHPLAQFVVPVARLMVRGANLSVNEAIGIGKKIAPFKGQYSALNIVYFSCDDTEGAMETVYQEIRGIWDNS